MKALLFLVIIGICEGQSTVKHSTISYGSSEVSALHQELKLLNEKLQRSNARLEKAVEENANLLNDSVRRLEEGINELRHERQAKVASGFMARNLTHRNYSKLYGIGQRVIFPEAVYNQGGHYNNVTGEYSCPFTGTYFFSFCVYGIYIKDGLNSRVSVVLIKAGKQQAEAAALSFGKDRLDVTASHSLVIKCNAGEKVWIQTLHKNVNLSGYQLPNVFSGFLLSID